MTKVCLVKDCIKSVNAKGLCKTHYLKKWKEENPEKAKRIERRYYKKNKSEILKRDKIYKDKNRDKILKRKKEHYAENRERLVNEKRKLRKKDPEKYNAIVRKSNKKHRTKILRKKKEEFQDFRRNVLTYYSKGNPKCKNCGIDRISILAIDHIYGRKAMGHSRNQSTIGLYRELHKKYPTGYQVLCFNCNMMKEIRGHKNHSKNPVAIRSRYYKKRTKKQVMEHYSNGKLKCGHCGFAEIDGLSIDHIEGRKKWGHGKELGSNRLYDWLKKNKFPIGFQVLCHNCNFEKR